MRKYIFKEIILRKKRERLAAKLATRIALDIVCNLSRDEATKDSEQSVRCLIVPQKPVLFTRVPVSTARVENLVAEEGGASPDGGAGDGGVKVVVAREEAGVARCLIIVASLGGGTRHQSEAGCKKERRKHFAFWSL